MSLMGANGLSTRKIIDLIYPVGSIYMSANAVSPQLLFGGSWEQIQGRFLLGASGTYAAGSTGGEATHKLTTNELPSHTHGGIYNYESTINVVGGGSDANFHAVKTSSRTVNTYATGGGQAHNNMPPYLVVYMWKRTA